MEKIPFRVAGLYALVNVADGSRWEISSAYKVGIWNFIYNINLRTAVCISNATLAQLPAVRRVSSTSARPQVPGRLPAWLATLHPRASVIKLTEALAEERADKKSSILPSIMDTPANRAELLEADFTRWFAPAPFAPAPVLEIIL